MLDNLNFKDLDTVLNLVRDVNSGRATALEVRNTTWEATQTTSLGYIHLPSFPSRNICITARHCSDNLLLAWASFASSVLQTVKRPLTGNKGLPRLWLRFQGAELEALHKLSRAVYGGFVVCGLSLAPNVTMMGYTGNKWHNRVMAGSGFHGALATHSLLFDI